MKKRKHRYVRKGEPHEFTDDMVREMMEGATEETRVLCILALTPDVHPETSRTCRDILMLRRNHGYTGRSV